MRFSIWPAPNRPWSEILELTQHCEQSGWDGVYYADHFMPNGGDATPLDGDTLECWSIMAALAAAVPVVGRAACLGWVGTPASAKHTGIGVDGEPLREARSNHVDVVEATATGPGPRTRHQQKASRVCRGAEGRGGKRRLGGCRE